MRTVVNTVLVGSALVVVSCDRPGDDRASSGDPGPAVAASDRLGDSIAASLAPRRQWKVDEVKVSLRSPDVTAELERFAGGALRVEAWRASNNDFHTPMIRVDGGELLYAITEEELAELSRHAPATEP